MDHTLFCPTYLSFPFSPNLYLVTEFILLFASGPFDTLSVLETIPQVHSDPFPTQTLTHCIYFLVLQEIQVEMYST